MALASGTLVTSALSVVVPTQKLLDLARRFRDSGIFTTYTRDVVCDAATNHTPMQILGVIEGLKREFSSIEGMEDVAQQVAMCIKPFLMTSSSMSEKDKEEYIALGFSPDDIVKIGASSKEAEEKMDDSVVQQRDRLREHGYIDNASTIFYMLLVLVKYTPRKGTFDLYHSYVYCKNYDALQWFPGTDKKKLLASLKVEGINLLGTTLAGRYSDVIVAKADDTGFKAVEEDLK